MITDRDIEKLNTIFVTKDDLKAMEDRQDKKYASKIELAELKESIPSNERFDKYTHQVLDKLDKVMAELETIRSEQLLFTNTQSEHSQQLEDHESRLQTLEKHP